MDLSFFDNSLDDFITLFVVVDPIGSIPVFIACTQGLSASESRKVAIRAIIYATIILGFFIVAGQLIIEALKVDLTSFQLAGGIVLFLFAMTMIFGDGKPANELKVLSDNEIKQIAAFPIAIPSIAGPGPMLAVVTLTDNHGKSVLEQSLTSVLLAVVLAITLVLLLLAGPIHRFIGTSGAAVISRVMGIILATLAVDNIVNAARELATTF